MKAKYVEDVIVPIIVVPDKDTNLFRYIGTGFYIDKIGYLFTCKHVTQDVSEDEKLYAYQMGNRNYLKLEIVNVHEKHDIALCKSSTPGDFNNWPIVSGDYISIGSDVEAYGYWHEPLGPDIVPFNQRYLKGHIIGFPREYPYRDSCELSFPVLFGLSGSPLIYNIRNEDNNTIQPCIAGCVYGSKESSVIRHCIATEEGHTETTARIVELGLSYKPEILIDMLNGTGTDVKIL